MRQIRGQLSSLLSLSWGMRWTMLATQGKQMEPQFNWISGTESFSVSCLITLDHIRNNDPRLFLSLWWHKEATEGDLEEEGGKGNGVRSIMTSQVTFLFACSDPPLPNRFSFKFLAWKARLGAVEGDCRGGAGGRGERLVLQKEQHVKETETRRV